MEVALCVIAKKENRYLDEFVGYYKTLGFSHIYIYDNNDVDGERIDDAIGKYVEGGFVDVIDCRGEIGAQLKVYNDCYAKFGAGTRRRSTSLCSTTDSAKRQSSGWPSSRCRMAWS